MPKEYGYDKAPKKSAAFKMKGFTYPGNSPVKGKRKQAELQSAKDRKYDAMSSIEDFAEDMTEGTDLTEVPNTNYGQTPLSKRAPLKSGAIPTQPVQQLSVDMGRGMTTNAGYAGNTNSYTAPAPKNSFSESFKNFMGSKAGIAASEALIKGAVNLGVTALTSGNKKGSRKRVSSADAFSRVNITGRS